MLDDWISYPPKKLREWWILCEESSGTQESKRQLLQFFLRSLEKYKIKLWTHSPPSLHEHIVLPTNTLSIQCTSSWTLPPIPTHLCMDWLSRVISEIPWKRSEIDTWKLDTKAPDFWNQWFFQSHLKTLWVLYEENTTRLNNVHE